MQLWATEFQIPGMSLSLKVRQSLHLKKSEFQQVAVVDTYALGRVLLLDGIIQTTDKDEFVYHEMITQVALNGHPNPENVLIIGGGDGGALREVVGHPSVKKGVMVEIDEEVVKASKEFFPQLSCSFAHEKGELIIEDGIKYVKGHKNIFDIIIVDSTDPIGPAVELFSADFYSHAAACLKEDGMLVVQSESPFFNADIIRKVYDGISQSFALTKLYLAAVPTYPGGLWSFTIGSKKHDPEMINNPQAKADSFKYYTPYVHRAAFKLPPFVQEIIL